MLSHNTKFEELLFDEAKAWESVQQFRRDFTPGIFNSVKSMEKDEAIGRAVNIFQETMSVVTARGFTFDNVDAGHGVGHLIRDYANALALLPKLDSDPRHTFIGFLGGTLHDLGCALVPRYEESKRAVRHAEVGALFLLDVMESSPSILLNDAERIAISYAIAAHTHYLKPSEVECKDGITRTVNPYTDTLDDGSPIQAIWFTRWVDRLDCNGPAFVARHYLTLHEDHENFDGESHTRSKFQDSMRPLFRTREERGNSSPTMSELMQMFADSQNNSSPYGKHDKGNMVELRDRHRELLDMVLQAVKYPRDLNIDSGCTQGEQIRYALYTFLTQNVEPSVVALKAATKLGERFAELPNETRHAWENGFTAMMESYVLWSREKLDQVRGYPDSSYKIPGITENIRDVLAPRGNWIDII